MISASTLNSELINKIAQDFAQATSLAVVAPGIAEALLATAIGLVAAIPAVIVYNGLQRANAGYRRLLGDASVRYADALGFAAAHIAGDIGVRGLERAVDHVLPGLTKGASWPALRAQLLQVQADGQDPIDALGRACAQPLSTAHDPCSVLAWRIADAERRDGGPLPWLPGVPAALAQHPVWGRYLAARRDLVADLSEQVRSSVLAAETQPLWLTGTTSRPTADLVAEYVWLRERA